MSERPSPKRYTMDDLKPIVEGLVPMPHPERITNLPLFLNNLASGGHSLTPEWGWAVHNDGGPDAGRKRWAQFFLRPASMGGRGTFDGSGYAVIYDSGHWDQETKTMVDVSRVVRFAICEHKKNDAAGANHSYGWHPGWCAKCGMDMTVDSSG